MGWTVRHNARHRSLRTALAIALALVSGTAAALGLGQIEVRSKIGQPLLAEIPIVSSDPAELEQLQVGPASPETFARIGLEPPQGIVSNLQFAVALDNAGNLVIRVTSVEPVNQALLTFLVEVDGGQGRLVREYSALIDAPRSVSALEQPPIEAPVIAPSDLIERPLDELPADAAPIADAEPEPSDEVAEIPPPMPETSSAPYAIERTPAPEISGEYDVRRGDTLSQIASRIEGAQGLTLDQTMIALLRANPDAFIGGNINLVKAGAVLRVPVGDELAAIDAAQASEIVRGQARQWRAGRAVPQPAEATLAQSSGRASNAMTSNTTAGTAATARNSSARLEIVPPGASGATQAGTQSGINAGGQGQMLRQEQQQTTETLAARDAELQELKSRVAELEKLRADQQQLMTLKDTELAAVQQRLATSQPAAPTTTATTRDSLLPWMLGGAGLLMLLLGSWWLHRRAVLKPAFRAPSPDMPSQSMPSLAAAFPSPLEPMLDNEPTTPAEVEPVAPSAPAKPVVTQTGAAPAVTADALTEDLWDRRERTQLPGGRPTAPAPAPAPAWHTGSIAKMASPPVANTPANSTPTSTRTTEGAGSDRLELAQAYLDLGDRDSARQLLGEVVVNGDHAARQQATRMLRELG